MIIINFTSNLIGIGVLAGGSQTLNVGATLNVGESQVAGVYMKSDFVVCVDYN